jgi:tetratricopeptide (TPR) repeat protein
MRRGAVERPADLATWELVIKAQALILEGTYETAMEAEALLRKSIKWEPGYAVSYSRLAEIGHNIAVYYSGIVGNDAASAALAEALDNAQHAARLSPLLVDARMWYGHLLLHHRRVDDGLRELREAVRINPSHAQARSELSLGLAISGEVDSALHELSVAFRLSPNDPRNDRIQTSEALAYLYADRYEEAAESARRVIDSQKGSGLSTFAYVVEVSALVRLGRIREAKTSADEYEGYFGALSWSAIERGAWSQSQLDRVRRDLQQVEMIPVL